MLRDKLIAERISRTPPLLTGVDASDFTGKDTAIQASSVDLSVGEIFRPFRSNWWNAFSDEAGQAHSEVILAQGETVTIRTREKLHMPNDVAGIAFPPARISTKGLLMTNTGHVDAGYSGYLHMTVINMGKKPQPIRKGDRLVSLLLFKLTAKAEAGWLERRGGVTGDDTSLVRTAQEYLSPDFMDIGERTKRAARIAMNRTTLSWALPILASAALAYMAIGATLQSDVAELRGRLDSIGSDVDLGDVNERLKKLEDQVKE